MIYLDRGRWVPEPSELEEYLATDENTEKAKTRESLEKTWRSWRSRYAMDVKYDVLYDVIVCLIYFFVSLYVVCQRRVLV